MEDTEATAADSAPMPETGPEMTDTGTQEATESSSSPEAAVDAAFAKLEAEEQSEAIAETPAEEPVEAQEAEQEQPEAEPEGEPAQNEWSEAPARMSEAAKAAWADTPPDVQADIHRTITEMENGIQQYKEAYEPFQNMAQHFAQTGQTPDEVFNFYSGMEDLLRTDVVGGFHQIASNLGLDIYSVAEHILNQSQGVNEGPTLEQQQLQQAQQQIQQLTAQIQGIHHENAQTRQMEATNIVAEFSKTHPRVDELSQDIATLIDLGKANSLEQAYEMAERLNPAPQPLPDPKPEPAPAQTRSPGSLSVDGAPNPGSNPGQRVPSKSADDAVDQALRRVGL
jgi:hypothetical protein